MMWITGAQKLPPLSSTGYPRWVPRKKALRQQVINHEKAKGISHMDDLSRMEGLPYYDNKS